MRRFAGSSSIWSRADTAPKVCVYVRKVCSRLFGGRASTISLSFKLSFTNANAPHKWLFLTWEAGANLSRWWWPKNLNKDIASSNEPWTRTLGGSSASDANIARLIGSLYTVLWGSENKGVGSNSGRPAGKDSRLTSTFLAMMEADWGMWPTTSPGAPSSCPNMEKLEEALTWLRTWSYPSVQRAAAASCSWQRVKSKLSTFEAFLPISRKVTVWVRCTSVTRRSKRLTTFHCWAERGRCKAICRGAVLGRPM